MKSTVEQRINKLLEVKNISKAKLAGKLNINRQSVGGWIKKGSIGKESALRIHALYPDINLKWLLGEDELMYVSSYKTQEHLPIEGEPCHECMRKQGIIDSLRQMLKAKENRIEELLTHKECGNNKKAC